MKILSAEQIRQWDEYTVTHEPIPSVELMERAASRCLEWLQASKLLNRNYCIFCGKGNNGGDGLALARQLADHDCEVIVYILEFGHKGTDDFQINLARLHQTAVEIRFLQTEDSFPDLAQDVLIIDALYGSGLNRPLEGMTADLIQHINRSGREVISIDLPSGLYLDRSAKGNAIIKADHTLSFQTCKLAFLMPENAGYCGVVHILDIGLSPEFHEQVSSIFEMTEQSYVHSLFRARGKFSHKGNFGHALLLAGSYGKNGAAVLCSRACLRSGVGLLTVATPGCAEPVLQTAVPEAMLLPDPDQKMLGQLPHDLSRYTVVGIGPGIGQAEKTAHLFHEIVQQYKTPMVIDADALNILSAHAGWLAELPPYSILTPHVKEFERLFGTVSDDFERVKLAMKKAAEYTCVIVLKGHYTLIALPDGRGLFNTTGNPGMAKGGSGDVLTGILTGLVAQGYETADAAVLGVYLHGSAGDLAVGVFSENSMLPSDLINFLGQAILALQRSKNN